MSAAWPEVVSALGRRSPRLLLKNENPEFVKEFRELVTKRAYDLYVQSGRAEGNDISNWLQAESELATIVPEIRRSRVWFTVSLSLPGVAAEDLRVYTQDDRTIIFAEKHADDGLFADERSDSAYYVVRWPANVEPETARANFENGNLTLIACQAE